MDLYIVLVNLIILLYWTIEFIHLIASEANDICERENKKTIAGEHVVAALQALGFDDYVEEVDDVYKEHKKQQKVKKKKENAYIILRNINQKKRKKNRFC